MEHNNLPKISIGSSWTRLCVCLSQSGWNLMDAYVEEKHVNVCDIETRERGILPNDSSMEMRILWENNGMFVFSFKNCGKLNSALNYSLVEYTTWYILS